MFWQSLPHSIRLFGLPQAWLLIAALLTSYAFYFWLVRLATSAKESANAAAPGCLVQLVGILFQGLWMGLFVLLLMPLALGIGEISWNQAESFALLTIRAGILASLAVALLSFIPGIGKLLGTNPGLEAFLIGAAVFRLSAPLWIERGPWGKPENSVSFPNAWESLAYLAFAFLLGKGLQIVVKALERPFPNSPRSRIILSAVGPTLDILAGILALSAYIHYVKLSLSG
jgi:hypothetical protein